MKKLGIVIPCYNCENTIMSCLNSIINQKESKDCQIVLVNDGSTDATKEILNAYRTRDNFDVYHQENQGVSAARNQGIKLCDSKYLMFVDSDDLLCKDSLKTVLNNVDKLDNSLFIYGINQEFYKKGCLVKEVKVKALKDESINLKSDSKRIIKYLENNLINGPYAKIFDLKVIKDNKIYFKKDLKIQEDLHFNIQYMKNVRKIYLYDKIIYRYLINGSVSITNKFLFERIDNYRYVENIIYDFLKDQDLDYYTLKEMYFISVKNTWSAIINSFFPGNNMTKNERKNFIKKILGKCDFEIINAASRPGIKYFLLKAILKTKNLFLIYHAGGMLSFLKRRVFLSYK